MKICTKCKVEKDELEFYKDKISKDGLKFWCKPCTSAYAAIYRQTPAYKEFERKRNQTAERKLYLHELRQTPEARAKQKEMDQRPDRKAKKLLFKRSQRGKAYNWERNVKAHGLTLEVYYVILEKQGGLCAICKTDKPGGKGSWHIDHDHNCCAKTKSCGKCVLGLLCHNCNAGRGYFKDDPDLLEKTAEYSRRTYIISEQF